jgi:hypothetical protein
MTGNWLKLHRSIMKSDVAQSDELLGLFVRILANINFQKGWFKQVEIQPGQMVFAWRTLKKRLYRKTGPSHNTIRSRVLFLASLGVLTIETHPSQRFSVLTVPNWHKYQSRSVPKSGTVAGTVPGTVPGTDIRRTKKGKNTGASLSVSDSSKAKATKPQWTMPHGVDPTHWQDWLTHRKSKRASNTPSAWSRIEREAVKAGLAIPAVVQICAERPWIGFEASWVASSVPLSSSEYQPFVASTTEDPIKPKRRSV